jgi:hypothetical protein
MGKTQVIDLDLKAYFDGVRHDVLLAKVARRISDDEVLHLLKIILKGERETGCSTRRCNFTRPDLSHSSMTAGSSARNRNSRPDAGTLQNRTGHCHGAAADWSMLLRFCEPWQ